MSRLVVALGSFALAIVVLPGCDDRARNEARMLLDRVDTLDDEPPVVRRESIRSLQKLAVSAPDVVRARDTCVALHKALLDAEEAQARAERLYRQHAPTDPHALLTPEARRDLDDALRRSETALSDVRRLQPRCEGEVGRLRTQYAIARPRS